MTLQSATAQDAKTLNEDRQGIDTEKPVTSRRLSIQLRMLSLFRRSPGIVVAGSIAVLFAAAYLLAPPMGRDLAAQVAHAEFARMHWPELLNLRWYSGFNPLGYSVLSPLVMAFWAYDLRRRLPTSRPSCFSRRCCSAPRSSGRSPARLLGRSALPGIS